MSLLMEIFQNSSTATASPYLVATSLVLLILLLHSLKVCHGRFWSSMERPVLGLHPLAGTVYHQILNSERLHHYYTELALKHTTFRILGARGFEVYTTDPANVEHILKTNFDNYGKGWYQTKIMRGLLGDGIFAVDGEKWRHQRKLASYDFSARMLRETSSQVFRNKATKLARIISDYSVATQQAVDIQDLFMKTSLESIFKVAFGTDLDNFGGSSSSSSRGSGGRFIRAFDESNAITFRRYADIFWEIERALNIGPEAKLKRNTKIIDDFIYELIREKVKQLASPRDADAEQRNDLISRFLVFSKEDPEKMNDGYLRDIILSIIIAGKDTTAITLSWFLYMLCENPLVQEKIADEIMEITGPRAGISSAEFAELVTEEALNNMHYLHAALTETLRLHPAVPVDYKSCLSDDTLPDGFGVKKGYKVGYLPYAMGRMKSLWGEDAEKFRPERWLDDDGVFRAESPFKFAAFQAGPRICLGKDFAYRQMKTFAAVLLRFFRFKLADEEKRVSYETMLTLHIRHGLHLRAFNR